MYNTYYYLYYFLLCIMCCHTLRYVTHYVTLRLGHVPVTWPSLEMQSSSLPPPIPSPTRLRPSGAQSSVRPYSTGVHCSTRTLASNCHRHCQPCRAERSTALENRAPKYIPDMRHLRSTASLDSNPTGWRNDINDVWKWLGSKESCNIRNGSQIALARGSDAAGHRHAR